MRDPFHEEKPRAQSHQVVSRENKEVRLGTPEEAIEAPFSMGRSGSDSKDNEAESEYRSDDDKQDVAVIFRDQTEEKEKQSKNDIEEIKTLGMGDTGRCNKI